MPAAENPQSGAHLARRFAALFYDLWVLAALWMLMAALALLMVGGDIDLKNSPLVWHLGLQIALILVTASYFVLSWIHGGQTIGMRAWRIRLQTADGQGVPARVAWLRFPLAVLSLVALGAGYWAALLDPAHRTFHDRLCATRVSKLS